MNKLLEPQEQARSDDFHKMYYHSKSFGVESWGNTYWMGIPVLKCPLDLWLYQEIMFKVRPDLVIETGTAHGGSALYLANLMDILGNGGVLTVDVSDKEWNWPRPKHPRITFHTGDSTSPEFFKMAIEKSTGKKVMVILDSDHHKSHVDKEISLFSPLVSPGSYLIVEDTNINGNPVGSDFGPGPMESVSEFLGRSKDFAVDVAMGKFFMSFNPFGYLCRVVK